LAYERHLIKNGYSYIAGVDEVGRGCIAGPVVAAAVVFLPEDVQTQDWIAQVKDSKMLSPAQRDQLNQHIMACARCVGIGMVDHHKIDDINILQASLQAMASAVGQLDPQPDYCLIDGRQEAPLSVKQETVIKGDQRFTSIAAASIVAKVYRDRWMIEQSHHYPEYGFEKHKGYGTPAHKQAIVEYGFCELHRRSFQVNLDRYR